MPAAKKKTIRKKPVKPKAFTQASALKRFGGKWPTVTKTKSSKFTYPTTAKGWTSLLNQALFFFYRERLAVYEGRKPRKNRLRDKYMYALYHIRPYHKKRRVIRGQHRNQYGLKVGDPRQVHHKNQKTMAFEDTELVTHCQHQRAHGKVCKKEKPKGKKKK